MKWITEVIEEQKSKKQKEFLRKFHSFKTFSNMNNVTKDLPRRIRIDLFTPAELAIYNAMQEVEKLAADIRLTDAIVLLQQAKDKVADFIDEQIKS